MSEVQDATTTDASLRFHGHECYSTRLRTAAIVSSERVASLPLSKRTAHHSASRHHPGVRRRPPRGDIPQLEHIDANRSALREDLRRARAELDEAVALHAEQLEHIDGNRKRQLRVHRDLSEVVSY